MKKPDIKQLLFILLPAVAVFVAALPSSVQIFPVNANQAEAVPPFTCSYFALIEDATGAIALPCAGLCAGIALMLAGIWAANKKPGLAAAVKYISMAASILAVVPILLKGTEIMVVPNVLVPIALLAEYGVAHAISKKAPAPEKAAAGRRLK